jgi:ribosomal protein S18 acetylase RimI-like enzyme
MTSDQQTSSPARLRLLTRADVPFADSLRALADWNQTRADWERFLATEPNGCFLAEWNGAPAGTATTIVYGPELAWIGMLLVHPDYRRRGLGRALLLRCLEYLRGRGVRCIKLDATPVGRAVYHGLGFQDEWTLRRWVGQRAGPAPATSAAGLRPWRAADAALVASLDAAAFGISRQRLLAALAPQSVAGLVVESEPGRLAGYGLLRPGSQALYLGPVVAESAEAGLCLVEGLLARTESQTVLWDIPDLNAVAVSWAGANGFVVQRPLTRMFLGENLAPGNPRQQFALAGPEVG